MLSSQTAIRAEMRNTNKTNNIKQQKLACFAAIDHIYLSESIKFCLLAGANVGILNMETMYFDVTL